MRRKERRKSTDRFIRKYYLKKLVGHKIGFLAPIFFVLGNIISVNIIPVVYGEFIQRIVEGIYTSIGGITFTVLVILGLHLVRFTLFGLTDYIWSRVSSRVQGEIALHSHEVTLRQSKSFFADNFSGSLNGKISTFSIGFQEMLREYSYNFLPSLVSTALIFLYVGSKSLILLIPFVASAIVFGIFVFTTKPKRKVLNETRQKASTIYQGHLVDSLSSVDTVKAEGAEKSETSSLSRPLNEFIGIKIKSMVFNNILGRVIAYIGQVFTMLALIFAVAMYINNSIDLALVLVMTSYAGSLIDKISALSNFRINTQDVYNSTFEMAEIMMMEPEIKDPINPTKLKIERGEITFQDANFKYTNSSEEVKEDEEDTTKKSGNKKEQQHLFQNLNLTIKPGEKIGLVGPSGGGKSTLLKLILRFYDVDSGKVLIDGVDVKDVIQSKLRQQIAYVPQDPALFHRSIGENIGYSKPNAKQKEIELAAQQAYADEFIESLPKGYETLVGERGVKLSGGQRQRVAIARAILKDAPILLLDEATSALDSESEKYIQKSLEKLMKGRTTVVVAHRLSTIQKMDRILVVENGKVIAEGPHTELLKTSPLYKKLWSHQSGGILQD
jgi:ATP-binding cassette, subfamily B, bacterial